MEQIAIVRELQILKAKEANMRNKNVRSRIVMYKVATVRNEVAVARSEVAIVRKLQLSSIKSLL